MRTPLPVSDLNNISQPNKAVACQKEGEKPAHVNSGMSGLQDSHSVVTEMSPDFPEGGVTAGDENTHVDNAALELNPNTDPKIQEQHPPHDEQYPQGTESRVGFVPENMPRTEAASVSISTVAGYDACKPTTSELEATAQNPPNTLALDIRAHTESQQVVDALSFENINKTAPENFPTEEGFITSQTTETKPMQCNHCGADFPKGINWEDRRGATNGNFICPHCKIGEVTLNVKQSVVQLCFHECWQCGTHWSHGLSSNPDDHKLKLCIAHRQYKLECDNCSAIRHKVADTYLKAEMHRSENKINGTPIPKDLVSIQDEEFKMCDKMTDEALERHIENMDKLSAQYRAKSLGARKKRANRMEAMHEKEIQERRRGWDPDLIDRGNTLDRLRTKKAKEDEKNKKVSEKQGDDFEKAVNAYMLAFNTERAEAEAFMKTTPKFKKRFAQ